MSTSRRTRQLEPPVAQWTAQAQRHVVVGLALLLPLVYYRGALAAFEAPKSALLLVGAATLLALQLGRTVSLGRLHVPPWPLTAVVAAFVVALLIAAQAGAWRPTTIFGQSRGSALLQYLSCLAVFLVIVRRSELAFLRRVAATMLLAGVLVSALSFMQRLGLPLQPFEVVEQSVGQPSTLANPNFASGYIGIVAPLWLWLFATSHTVRYRAVLGLAGVVLVAGLYGTDSLQGFIAAAAGIGVALVIMVKTLPARLRKPAFASLAGGGVFGLVLLAAGLGGVGPLSALAADSAFTVRSWYWGAAIAMWATRPLVGVGLDQYGSFYRTYRPLEDALSAPLNLSNDAAHSVPLMMLASGGIILAVAYVAFILYALWNAAGGVRRLEGDSLRLLGGVAGAWVAYQVQSLVSIDVPALAVAHFTLAGALVGLAGITTREVRLPWASAASNFRRQPALQWLAAAASGALLLVGLMLGTLPLRADVRAGQGARLLDAGRSAEAVPELQRAVKMAPWETRYRVLAGRALHDAGRVEEARAQFLEAVASEPRNIEALIWSGRMSALLEDYAAAEKWYGRVLAVEPLHPAPKVELARMQASRGELGAARELLAQALATDPNNAEALTLQDEIESLS